MASKYQMIVEAAEQESHRITVNPENWMSFLITASNNYKYRFKDQLLIHAQKPNAIACAEIETWNRLGRWVNKGTKGITLLADRDTPYRLRHVFDLSDTNSRAGRGVYLWQMAERYESTIVEALENSFGEIENKSGLASVLFATAHNTVEDNFSDYYSDLLSAKANSFLEELDEPNIEVWFKTALANSIGFMLLTRCGLNPHEYFSNEDFARIRYFNTPETVALLGGATSDIAKMVLLEIGATVKNLQIKERQTHTFADKINGDYNVNRNTDDERSFNNGNDLYPAGRLSDSQFDRSRKSEDWKIWNAAAQLPSGSQGRNLYGDAVIGQAKQSSGGNRSSGQRNDGTADFTDGARTGREREPKSIKSDEVGAAYEQHQEFGGGNRDGGADLLLSEPLRTVEEQQNIIAEAEAEKVSAFVISQEDIDAVLTRGSGISQGKFRIYEQYLKQESAAENIRFLKDEYGVGGSYPAVSDRKLDEGHDSKGIKISRGSLMQPDAEILLSWSKAEKHIGELIKADSYLSAEEKKAYNEELIPSPETNKEYRYSLGDTVYLGANECEILAFDENTVRLYDTSFPLFNKELLRTEFDAKLRENPLNEHLLQAVEPVQPVQIREAGSAKESAEIDHAEQPKSEMAPAEQENFETPNISRRNRTQIFDLHSEIPQDDRYNYHIFDDELGAGTSGERYQNNVAAIRLLKKLEEENRFAAPAEQEVLAKYIGWGGLAECFDKKHSKYLELRALLSEDEYASARESTLTAFYTPPVVVRSIYQALENMNFKTGNILEPSCGTGNFLGMLPESMRTSKLYGVELDSISGRIAQQLYQKFSVAVQGYENTDLPDSFFDAAIGNVPFGQFKVPDKRYDKNNFLIHDYFFARTLDKVRPGGIIAFVTSKGTLDKENPAARKYIAQRADLLGAIRLPNNTFKSAAGTEVTSDIIFLQKRDRLIDIEPDWVYLNTDENGVTMSQYFIDNPDMILGEMKIVSGQFGPESACAPYDGQNLAAMLDDAVSNIHAEVTEYEMDDWSEEEDSSIPSDPSVRNFSYTIVDGKLYYRENSRMNPVDVSVTAENRIKGMIDIRDCVRLLIEYQTEDYPEPDIKEQQKKLNRLYDAFSENYGLINSRANNSVFSYDSSYYLLTSLEVLDDEGNFLRKADMFSKRTIKQKTIVTSVDTASEALSVSLAEKAGVDMPYMMELTGKSEQELFFDLTGVIFLNPLYNEELGGNEKYLTADAYLSGNVREKLASAKCSAEFNPQDYTVNVKALEAVQPVNLTASEISVRLGATWLPPELVEQFMFELFSTPRYCQWNVLVHYSEYTGEWNVEGKNYDRSNIKASNTYGTGRINGYKIIEETLNLRDVRIFDYVEDAEGRKQAVLNRKETAIAQGKQELIKSAFAEWIWNDPERREQLCKLYNEKFNSSRAREYDGSFLNFVGINPEITLRKHQVDAIARAILGGNTLLAHVVGAGKTFEMVAAAQESKRLGLCQKSLFVVPNHLTEQWASEYLQLYPSANILVASKKDFETKKRKTFCGRIATGDYDAVIIGHSQFEKIPMSIERQRSILEQQLEEIIGGIAELKHNKGDNFSVKQLEKTKKIVKQKLDKLNDQTRKDDVVTFEELGVDRLFIDEAHYYKNLAAFSKMRNVGGISQTEAQKSSDLYMKCRYLDELTGGHGIIFATGTPVSNSMVEMYTMQKYLQYGALKRSNLLHFDSWASTFGETVTAIELAPEGTGYRAKTRFAKFYNLPELIMMFREVADIQTADILKLPVPKANYHTAALKPSKQQKEMVESLSERAEKVRNKMVDSSIDNMLLITNDGRKLALDQRLMNELLPDSEAGKTGACAQNVYEIWERTKDQHSAQMIFCDLSTPHGDDKFNVYDDIRTKLITKGIPAKEIAFIHSASSEVQKKELFGKVRSGQIRVLLGSTQKMGAGTNVQQKLTALHHLDCPWRPADLQQREGRIIRQGNENPEVEIFSYVTEGTFDAYLYQLVESKQKFIGQIMTSKSPVRSAEDIDETALSYAEIKALASGNPQIKEKMDLDIEVQRLKLLKANHLSQRYSLEDQIIKNLPQQICSYEERITGLKADIKHLTEQTNPNGDGFSPMTVQGKACTEKKDAGAAILAACKAMTNPDPVPLGQYRGFSMELSFDSFSREFRVMLKNVLSYTAALGSDIFGNIQRIDNLLDGLPEKLKACDEKLDNTRTQLKNAKVEVEKPFPHEEELKKKSVRLDELNILLNMDKRENEIADGEPENCDQTKNKEFVELER